jgi:hypothetical protein
VSFTRGNSARTRARRAETALGAASIFVLGLLFACANSEDGAGPSPEAGVQMPDGGSDTSVSDSTVEDALTDVPVVVPGQCSKGGFCFVSLPVQAPIIAVSASNVDDAWMLPNETQTILRWDGSALNQVYEYTGATPAKVSFGAIWAEKKDNVWAVASDSNFRFFVVRYAPVDGGPPVFRELPTEEFATNYLPGARVNSIWGTAASDTLWVAAGQSVLRLHDNGGSTLAVDRFMPSGGPGDRFQYQWYSIRGFADDDIYVGGQGSSPAWGTRGALAHYDGTAWSIQTFDGNEAVLSLRGTTAGQTRQLWYSRWRNLGQVSTRLASIGEDGGLGEGLFTVSSPACNATVGDAVTPTAGWFSNGLVVCRWTGTTLEDTATALGGRPIVQKVNAIWAGSADDTWIVGESTAFGGFAARRTRATADGGTP